MAKKTESKKEEKKRSLKLKIFSNPVKNEKDINTFLEGNAVLADGISFKDDDLFIIYMDKKEKTIPDGLSKDEALLALNEELKEVQRKLIAKQPQVMYYKVVQLQNTGSKDQRTQVATELAKVEKEMENLETQVRQYRAMMKDVDEGTFTF